MVTNKCDTSTEHNPSSEANSSTDSHKFSTFYGTLTHWGQGHLNCLNARSQGLNNFNQLLYCVSLKIYNKIANYFCELKFSGNTHQKP
jgi:hypothetical protein